MPGTIDETAYPHIIKRILSFVDRSTLLAFRGTSKRLMNQIDEKLFEHVAVVQSMNPRLTYMRSPHAPYRMLPRVPTLETIDLSKFTTLVDFYPTVVGLYDLQIPGGEIVNAHTYFVDPRTTRVPLFRERGLCRPIRGPPVVRGPGQIWRSVPYADAVVLSFSINRRLRRLPPGENCEQERGLTRCKEFVVHFTWEDTNFNDVSPTSVGLKDIHVWINPKHIRPSDKFTLVIDPPPKEYMQMEPHLRLRDDILDALCHLFTSLAGHFQVYGCHPRISIVGLEHLDKNLGIDGAGFWIAPAQVTLEANLQLTHIELMDAMDRAEEQNDDCAASDGGAEDYVSSNGGSDDRWSEDSSDDDSDDGTKYANVKYYDVEEDSVEEDNADEDEDAVEEEEDDKEDDESEDANVPPGIPNILYCEPYDSWCKSVNPAYRKGRVGIKQAMVNLMVSGLFTPARYLRTRAGRAEAREKQKQENLREVEKKRKEKKAKKALALEIQAAAIQAKAKA